MKDCINIMSGISKIKILLLQFLSIAIVSVVASEGSAQPQSAKERRAALSKKLRDTDFEILKLFTDEIDRNKKGITRNTLWCVLETALRGPMPNHRHRVRMIILHIKGMRTCYHGQRVMLDASIYIRRTILSSFMRVMR